MNEEEVDEFCEALGYGDCLDTFDEIDDHIEVFKKSELFDDNTIEAFEIIQKLYWEFSH